MDKTELCKELAAVRQENRKLQQQLEWTRKELEEWQCCAILLSPEEIFEFYKLYREKKQQECEKKDEKAREELNRLTTAVLDLRKRKGREKVEDEV